MNRSREEQKLLDLIINRRRSLDVYLKKMRPRSERLLMVTIVSSALAAVLNAGPALGGTDFTGPVAAALNLGSPAAVWRPLCMLAMIVSVVAVISANLGKSKSSENRIASAETANGELESLEILIDFHQLPLKEAITMYQQSVARVPFVPRGSHHNQSDDQFSWVLPS
jgi:hypothetical protein